MGSEDDTFMIIIGEDEDRESGQVEIPDNPINQELEEVLEDSDLTVENILDVAFKVGKFIKLEPEFKNSDQEEWLSEDECIESDVPTDSDSGSKRRKPEFRNSFVDDLKAEYPELRHNETKLISTLVGIMKSCKQPTPPKDYVIMNDILYECSKCGALTESVPLAKRHWQASHGKRYLVCYACGVDFRSCLNLYKHEKRCVSKDALIVLKARAIFLGKRGKGRLKAFPELADQPTETRWSCKLCSASFKTKENLKSHENLHRGVRPFRCHQCPCAYTSIRALARHLHKHKNLTFICDHCERPFNSKPILIRHLDTHAPLRKFACKLCDKRYAQKSALRVHVSRVHLNLPPPCACKICPKRYPRMSLLKEHMKKAHGMSLMTRMMFFKTLPTLTDMEIQQSKFEIDKLVDNTANIQSMNEDDIDPYLPIDQFLVQSLLVEKKSVLRGSL